MAAARKKGAALPETRQEIPQEEIAEFLSAEDVNPALQLIYSEMGITGDGQHANVYVYKEMPDGNDAQIWKGAPDDYKLEPLTKKFGSGNYRVKIYVKGEYGNMVVKANQIIRVLLDPAEDARIEAARNPAPVNALAQHQPQYSPADIAAAVAQALPKQTGPSITDIMAMVTGLLTAMKPELVTAPVNVPQFNPMDMFKMGVELAKNATGGGDPVDPMTKLIETFGPPLAAHYAQSQQPVAQPAQIVLPAPQPEMENPEMLPAARQRAAEIAAAAQLKAGLAFLVNQATGKRDPALYAEMVADQVPDEVIQQFLDDENWLAYLCQFDPRIAQHTEWFGQLRKALGDLYAPEPEVPDANEKSPALDTPEKPA